MRPKYCALSIYSLPIIVLHPWSDLSRLPRRRPRRRSREECRYENRHGRRNARSTVPWRAICAADHEEQRGSLNRSNVGGPSS